MSCPECEGRGWVRYTIEAVNGEMETAYRICGCGRTGEPVPVKCKRPGCDSTAGVADGYCGNCRAEWDMNAEAEAWALAEESLTNFARGVHAALRLDQADEAMQGAVAHCQIARLYYEQERDRIRGAS